MEQLLSVKFRLEREVTPVNSASLNHHIYMKKRRLFLRPPRHQPDLSMQRLRLRYADDFQALESFKITEVAPGFRVGRKSMVGVVAITWWKTTTYKTKMG